MDRIPRLSTLSPSRSKSSIAASDTTYHSFHDIELFAPASPTEQRQQYHHHHHHHHQPESLNKMATAGSSSPLPTSPLQKENQQPLTQQLSSSPDQYYHHARQQPPSSSEMHRQDSGYESLQPRLSTSSASSPRRKRRTSTISSSGSGSTPAATASTSVSHHQRNKGSQSRPTTAGGSCRPVIRRAAKTCPYLVSSTATSSAVVGARPPNPLHALATQQHHQHHFRSTHRAHHQQPRSGFFHFPAHPTDLPVPPRPVDLLSSTDWRQHQNPHHQQPGSLATVESDSSALVHEGTPQPTQSTHYWTSDRTRRLEYAAIDAAHRGVKGWVRRHLVPDCFIPKEKARVPFDDDTGSVRRYRLSLDEEGSTLSGLANESQRDDGKPPRAWSWTKMKSW